MIATGIPADPFHHSIGIMQRGREFPFGGQTVIEVYKGKAASGHIHAITAIDFLGGEDLSGILDEQTSRSVASFQKIAALQQTGNVDRVTWLYLVKHFTLNVHADDLSF